MLPCYYPVGLFTYDGACYIAIWGNEPDWRLCVCKGAHNLEKCTFDRSRAIRNVVSTVSDLYILDCICIFIPHLIASYTSYWVKFSYCMATPKTNRFALYWWSSYFNGPLTAQYTWLPELQWHKLFGTTWCHGTRVYGPRATMSHIYSDSIYHVGHSSLYIGSVTTVRFLRMVTDRVRVRAPHNCFEHVRSMVWVPKIILYYFSRRSDHLKLRYGTFGQKCW